MAKHKRGYFKGKYKAYLLTAYTSYRKSTEVVTNKDLAKELGVSLSTLQRYKRGEGLNSKKALAVKNQIEKNITYAGRLNQKGKILYKAVKKLRSENPTGKKIKELSVKQMNRIKNKVAKEEETLTEIFEAFYEGENE